MFRYWQQVAGLARVDNWTGTGMVVRNSLCYWLPMFDVPGCRCDVVPYNDMSRHMFAVDLMMCEALFVRKRAAKHFLKLERCS